MLISTSCTYPSKSKRNYYIHVWNCKTEIPEYPHVQPRMLLQIRVMQQFLFLVGWRSGSEWVKIWAGSYQYRLAENILYRCTCFELFIDSTCCAMTVSMDLLRWCCSQVGLRLGWVLLCTTSCTHTTRMGGHLSLEEFPWLRWLVFWR